MWSSSRRTHALYLNLHSARVHCVGSAPPADLPSGVRFVQRVAFSSDLTEWVKVFEHSAIHSIQFSRARP